MRMMKKSSSLVAPTSVEFQVLALHAPKEELQRPKPNNLGPVFPLTDIPGGCRDVKTCKLKWSRPWKTTDLVKNIPSMSRKKIHLADFG